MEGVAPIRSAYEDVGTPFDPFIGKENETDYTDEGPDRFLDLTLKFDKQAVVEAELGGSPDGDVFGVTSSANLMEGSLIQGGSIFGVDVVRIWDKKKN